MNINDELLLKIEDITTEGEGVSKFNNAVIFIDKAIPEDYVKARVISKKKNYYKAEIIDIVSSSLYRQEPICKHFGLCGGCKWLHFKYEHLIKYKEKQVYDQLERIGNLSLSEKNKIIPSDNIYYYRNKLEFTFYSEFSENNSHNNVVGFHLPKHFDKVIDISQCFLQPEPSNSIRNFIKQWSKENNLTYYNPRLHTGTLRNLIIRNNSSNEFMVILVVTEFDKIFNTLSNILFNKFTEIKSIYYIKNLKKNSSLQNTEVIKFEGEEYITEKINDIEFKIRPLSFFQVNINQTAKIYSKIEDFVKQNKHKLIYDLYCGVGTISLCIAKHTNKVIGIDNSEMAILDAKVNADQNSIENAEFFCGDILKTFNNEFLKNYGKPDIIITDPPRSGMHKKVTLLINELKPEYVIYLSCNPATQARDINLLSNYKAIFIQPYDMFPFTSHTENLVILERC